MKTYLGFVLLAIAATFSACTIGGTFVKDEYQCGDTGTFRPGPGVATCDLYGKDGRFLETVAITQPNGRYCNLQAYYIKCFDEEDNVTSAEDVLKPLCPFDGEEPECKTVAPIVPIRRSR